MIALSIVYVAVQNLITDQLSRHRLPVIFGFGLLHGLEVCVDFDRVWATGRPLLGGTVMVQRRRRVWAAGALGLRLSSVHGLVNDPSRYRRVVSVPRSLLIAAVGALWVLERVVYFYVS